MITETKTTATKTNQQQHIQQQISAIIDLIWTKFLDQQQQNLNHDNNNNNISNIIYPILNKL